MRRVLLTLFALFVTLTVSALWYASNRGFTSKWRRHVTEEFRKRGVEITLRRLTLDPRRGIVAKEVRVFDARDRRRTLAVIDEMVLQINFANLMHDRTFLDALDLRDASLSFPIDPEKPEGKKIEISHLNGRLFLPPQQLYLANAEADVLGLHVSASGRLIHPQAFQLSASSPGTFSPELLTRIIDEIKATNFEGGPPALSLTFSGDLAQPEEIVIELAFWGERIRRQRYSLSNLYVGASLHGGVLDLKQLVATDTAGELRVTGLWNPAAHHAQMQLRSTVDAASLVRACGDFPWLDDFVFYAPPVISLRLDATLGDKMEFLASGQASAGKFAYRSVVFEHAETGFSWDGTRWSLRDAVLRRANGEELKGDALRVAGDFRAQLTSTLNPKAFRPLLPDSVAATLRQFEFPHPPRVTLEAHGLSPEIDTMRVDGEASLGPASFRGVPAESVHGTLHYENRVLSVSPFRLERTEGDATGSLLFDFQHDEVRFDKVRTRLNPPDVAMWIDPNLVADILPFHFVRQPPSLLIDGLAHTQNGGTTELHIEVNAPDGMDYTFVGKNLAIRDFNAQLFFTHDHVRIPEFSGSLLGGVLSGDADVSRSPTRPERMVRATLANIDFSRLAKLYFGANDAHGRLDGRYEFRGDRNDSRSVEAHGQWMLTDGSLFEIPFLGPLRDLLDLVTPGVAREAVPYASSIFSIENGAIATDELVIHGKAFDMLGKGRLLFLDNRADFTIRAKPDGFPGLLLAPVTRLFEFAGSGSIAKPEWRLRFIPQQ